MAYPTPIFFMKMTAKDDKEITYMPLVTFFSVLERPGKNHKGVATTPPLFRRGLTKRFHELFRTKFNKLTACWFIFV